MITGIKYEDAFKSNVVLLNIIKEDGTVKNYIMDIETFSTFVEMEIKSDETITSWNARPINILSTNN